MRSHRRNNRRYCTPSGAQGDRAISEWPLCIYSNGGKGSTTEARDSSPRECPRSIPQERTRTMQAREIHHHRNPDCTRWNDVRPSRNHSRPSDDFNPSRAHRSQHKNGPFAATRCMHESVHLLPSLIPGWRCGIAVTGGVGPPQLRRRIHLVVVLITGRAPHNDDPLSHGLSGRSRHVGGLRIVRLVPSGRILRRRVLTSLNGSRRWGRRGVFPPGVLP